MSPLISGRGSCAKVACLDEAGALLEAVTSSHCWVADLCDAVAGHACKANGACSAYEAAAGQEHDDDLVKVIQTA